MYLTDLPPKRSLGNPRSGMGTPSPGNPSDLKADFCVSPANMKKCQPFGSGFPSENNLGFKSNIAAMRLTIVRVQISLDFIGP